MPRRNLLASSVTIPDKLTPMGTRYSIRMRDPKDESRISIYAYSSANASGFTEWVVTIMNLDYGRLVESPTNHITLRSAEIAMERHVALYLAFGWEITEDYRDEA